MTRRFSAQFVGVLLLAAVSAVAAENGAVREGYVSVPGGRVWYRIVGSGGGVPVLILHGGPGFPHDYLDPLEALSKERPVVFYDQLGCGKSDRPSDSNLWRVERFVEELARVREELGLKEVHILGQSWGTQLAVDYTLTHPTGIVSLILADPALSIPRWVQDANAKRATLPKDVQAVLARHEAAGFTHCLEYQAAASTSDGVTSGHWTLSV